MTVSAAPPAAAPLSVRRDAKNRIYSPIRKIWLIETPEEQVRQEYLCTLVNEYGYTLDQMDEERSVVGRGSSNARADFLLWRSASDKRDKKHPLIVVECKARHVPINQAVYEQGAHYAQYTHARFFIAHNAGETRFFEVDHTRLNPNWREIENIPLAGATDRQIEDQLKKLKVFREDEFADLLRKCHDIIRNQQHLDPAAAFDEIAKLLFVKVGYERRQRENRGRRNIFSAQVMKERKDEFGGDPLDDLFKTVKDQYRADGLFKPDEKINLTFETAQQIVAELQLYNLSDTGEDVKGIAFERFLGRTFRGEIGQFFTPRPIVEFLIRLADPQEGEVICDPASGSGGFLIRFFQLVREKILARLDAEYEAFKAETEARTDLSDSARAALLRDKYNALQATRDKHDDQSPLWHLANRCIYGTDANDRMARTSKMNMILHGDGHGGVHHHNGFLNVNGIFEGRFDLILTNPPFGANVEGTHKIRDEDIAVNPEAARRYTELFGTVYTEAQARLKAAVNQSLATLFQLPKIEVRSGGRDDKIGKVKTEILFIERCLSLLKPGGRLGIVLPEGIFNNPSLAYVREFCEDRAFLRAVVSLPQETFASSGASVKASLLFVQKFTDDEQAGYDTEKADAMGKIRALHDDEIRDTRERFGALIDAAKAARDTAARKTHEAALKAWMKRMEEQIQAEARQRLKEQWDYPVFLYEAEKVGITATGEADANELYPNERLPVGVASGETALELYRQFRADPTAFLLGTAEETVESEEEGE